MKHLLLLLLASPLWAADTQEIQAQIDSLTVVLRKAQGDSLAATKDSLVQADATLKAAKIKIANGDKGGGDPAWCALDLRQCSQSHRLTLLETLVENKIEYSKSDTASVYLIRKDRLEKAIPLLSNALK